MRVARSLSSCILAVLVPSIVKSSSPQQPTPAQSAAPHRKVPPPPPPPPAADQELVIPYWTTETGWSSELQLRNNVMGQDLTVMPALRLPDGTETPLAPVTIKSQEVKSIDTAAAIFAASAPQLIGTYGSAVLRYHSSSPKALYASVMIRAMSHAIAFHVDGSAEYEGMPAGSREGIWWLPKDTTSDYLILTNQGKNALALDLSLYDASGRENQQKVLLGSHATNRLSVRNLLQTAGLAGSYGGIKISAASRAGWLDTLHFVFDTGANFSAILKMFDHDPDAKLEERDFAGTRLWTLRAPMLALSNPDPALAFPPGTVLRPQIFIRNTTAKPIDAALRFNWRAGSTTGKAAGPQLHLVPYETRLVDVAALQDGTVLPKEANWTSVTLASNALPDELMAVSASYDQTLKYGAQTPFSDQLSHEWKGGMWEFDPYHDSIITAGNGGTQPTQAAFTIFYNQGTRKYELQQTLQPDEQMWIDVGKVIQLAMPDENGNTLPRDLTSGSYEFRDLTHTGVGTLFEGKVIYDKTYGHVAYGCATCCGYNATELFSNPLLLPVPGPPVDNGVWGYNVCDQQYDDVSSSFFYNWSTLDGAVATVDCCGTHTPHAVGATTSNTSGSLEGTAHYPICPNKNFAPNGGDTVRPVISSYDPTWGQVGTSVLVSIYGQGFGNAPTVIFPTGSGITVSYSTQGDQFIGASFEIASNAPGGFTYFKVQNNTALDGSTPSSDPASFQVTPATAVPVNFRQFAVNMNPAGWPVGTLEFVYYWDSSSGNVSDLANCSVGEIVNYPNQGTGYYWWTSPPYQNTLPYGTKNPFTSSIAATNILPPPYYHAGFADDHFYPNGQFQTPYTANNFTSNQTYRFQCSNYQSGAWENIVIGIGIQRTVTRNVNGTYRYDIYKSGSTNSVNPMP